MSKITFRADDDLIDRLEERETSKSESMREALRQYLDGASEGGANVDATSAEVEGAEGAASLDDLVANRIDDLLAERAGTFARPEPRDVNVNITLDGDSTESIDAETETSDANPESRKTPDATPADASNTAQTCDQCGENIEGEFVYCPNCGEKSSHRVFCDCGDELRSDWAFCPSCGRRTPAADVLDGA